MHTCNPIKHTKTIVKNIFIVFELKKSLKKNLLFSEILSAI